LAQRIPRIRRLAELGHELRRPEVDYLRDSIYELRARRGRVNYRILYFFHGPNVAVLAHTLTKEGEIPVSDIERTVRRKHAFDRDPARHTYEGEVTSG
jgi:phage-related protein